MKVLTSKSSNLKTCVLLGVVALASNDLLPTFPNIHEEFLIYKNDVLEFYKREILGSKTTIPEYIIESFNPIFNEYISKEDFTRVILPDLEKSFLRSPEVIFDSVSQNLFKSLSYVIDLSEELLKNLLKYLLSSFKSSKELIRIGSFETFVEIVKNHCNDKTKNNEILEKITIEIITPLKTNKLNNADQKSLYAQAIEQLPQSISISKIVVNNLLSVVGKEVNEIALSSILNSFFKHLFFGISNDDFRIEKSIIDIIKKGLSDKRSNIKKVWITKIASQLLFENHHHLKLIEFLNLFNDEFLKAWEEVVSNPLFSIQNKFISTGYSILCIASILNRYKSTESESIFINNKLNIFEKSLSSIDLKKPSMLTSFKIYTKLITKEDQYWYLESLSTTIKFVKNDEIGLNWTKAWINLILSKDTLPEIRRSAIQKLSNDYIDSQQIVGDLLIKSLFELLSGFYENDLIKSFNYKYLSGLLNLFINNSEILNKDILISHLKNLLIIVNDKKISIKDGWVGLCLRGGIDPGEVISKNSKNIVNFISEQLYDNKNDEIFEACFKSIGQASFIAPNEIVPLITDVIKTDLDKSRLVEITEDKLEIWKTPEGTLAINVLEKKKPKYTESKNVKDYNTKKWEEDIKKEIERKKQAKGITKKLTKEELTARKEQLEKEHQIRIQIQDDYLKLRRGVGLVKALAEQSAATENGINVWLPVSVNKLLDILNAGANKLLGNLGYEAFLAITQTLNERLGSARYFIGVATLRVLNIDLDSSLTEEPLDDLILRILYKIKFLADQKPLDSNSLIFILPLLTNVLIDGESKSLPVTNTVRTDEDLPDTGDEEVLLSLGILTAHSEVFGDPSIPCGRILKSLLSLMTTPSRGKIAKECFLRLCEHIGIVITRNDLDILLSNTIISNVFVRTAVLEAIDAEMDIREIGYSSELWIACHDSVPSNAELARTIWEESELKIDLETPTKLLDFLDLPEHTQRLSVAEAITESIESLQDENNDVFSAIFKQLMSLYDTKSKPPAPILDEYGLIVKTSYEQKDPWEARSGVALTIKGLSPYFNSPSTVEFFEYIINTEALADKEPSVGHDLQEAGVSIIERHGKRDMESIAPIFEKCLSLPDKNSTTQDRVREAVIIMYGALAQHLSSEDQRLLKIVNKLIATLDTPSEDVQYAVSECLAPLVNLFKPELGNYLEKLIKKLLEGKKMASRRGAAYGIAGLVKGAGIRALADYDIIRTLCEASEDKKDSQKREGAIFGFECLSQSLGKYFEPYVIEVLPTILSSLGDFSNDVRDATGYATKIIMKNTTGYGVKQFIPLAIENLDEHAWRTKKGSVDLLGSMAYLDPTQLSYSLSKIIPELVGVLGDTHKEVRNAANRALKSFGDVIRNPEIQALVPILIKAIGNPTKHTDEALDALTKTQFVHYIDAPSLALVIHVIDRGLKDRSAAVKKKACQIVGNMAILVDSKDLIPHLPLLVSELENSMVDPVPQTRATAARALGSLVEKLGEDQFPDLIPRLLDTLRSEDRAGDRLGAAQGLSEVICGLGIHKLDELLPVILQSASSSKSYIRQGFMPLLIFLPACFGNSFSPYLSKVIPPILSGLADKEEGVRDTALRAGRYLVKNYATKAVDLLLPELERGLSDYNYRIRLSSVELTGDLLFQIGGITGKTELSEDEYELSGAVNKTLIAVLGQERRDRILASLFVCRFDTAGIVRNSTVDMWKSLVANTPRTIKEILPTLTQIIIKRLASPNEEQRSIAAQTLGELVRRVGGNALSQLLPTLENGLDTTDPDAKQGICIALRELIESTSADNIEKYQSKLINIIKRALIDSDANVREAAAQSFDALQESIGNVAIDEIIPHLLNQLEATGSSSEYALLALQEIMATKSDVIFPILIPTLLSPPIDAFKATALGSLAEVAGTALYRKLSTIINALIDAILLEKDEEVKADIESSFDRILLSVDDEEGTHPLLKQLISIIKDDNHKKRSLIYKHLSTFFKETTLDYSAYTEDIVVQCIVSLDDRDLEVVTNDWNALTQLIKSQPKDALEKLIRPARDALSITGTVDHDLPGFSLPKGPSCILPIFLHGLMYGSSDLREVSAMGIADLIQKSSVNSLKPFVTMITGPLIRTIGERFPSGVKAAILYALNILFSKVPQFLRPFIPQLQRTFVKSLSDPNDEVLRTRAAKAIGNLIGYQPRVDPLVAELVTGSKTDDIGVKNAMLKALIEVSSKAGSKMSEVSKVSVMTLVEVEISDADVKLSETYARLLGSLAKILSTDEATKLIKSKILTTAEVEEDDAGEDSYILDDTGKFGVLSINAFLKDAPFHIFNNSLLKDITNFIMGCIESKSEYISENGVVAAGKLLLLNGTKGDNQEEKYEVPFPLSKKLIETLSKAMQAPVSSSNDTRRLSLVVVRTIARANYDLMIRPHLDILGPAVFVGVRELIIPIKLAAEKAYLGIFKLVEDPELQLFNKWFSTISSSPTVETTTGKKIQTRSIGDYTKRVGARLASVERERIAAGGDEETMFSDRFEDEREIWAIGGVEINNNI